VALSLQGPLEIYRVSVTKARKRSTKQISFQISAKSWKNCSELKQHSVGSARRSIACSSSCQRTSSSSWQDALSLEANAAPSDSDCSTPDRRTSSPTTRPSRPDPTLVTSTVISQHARPQYITRQQDVCLVDSSAKYVRREPTMRISDYSFANTSRCVFVDKREQSQNCVFRCSMSTETSKTCWKCSGSFIGPIIQLKFLCNLLNILLNSSIIKLYQTSPKNVTFDDFS